MFSTTIKLPGFNGTSQADCGTDGISGPMVGWQGSQFWLVVLASAMFVMLLDLNSFDRN